jgi:pyruvate/2-oxoglutarate dehydrogenase complex dihydrolipoamide dehydrogenase (E3) component/uncharacterized membrane protein YdjX (TVP38/TMEM64 family)
MSRHKILIVLALAGVLAVAYALDLHRWLTLDALRAGQRELEALRAQHPFALAAGYFAVYVAATALSFPGAAVLTLAGGAVFGLAAGLVLVSLASTLGAVLAFLVARFVLADAVRARLGGRLADVDRGVERDGAFHLLTLRLVPVVPFFLVNLGMGLTRMPVRTYAVTSWLGMLPGTLVYVNAGTQLAAIDSLGAILSPALIGSFVLLAALPWIGRGVVRLIRDRRALARWAHARPRRFDRNLVVIGAGAAGLVSAYIAAAVRARVTLVERHRMGGDCLHTGCVPSKALIRSARLAHAMRHADRWGLEPVQPQVRFRAVLERVQAVIRAIEPHDSVERYTALGVDVVQGTARIVDPWTVEIARADGTTQRLHTRAIVIAAGAEPVVPPIPGTDGTGYLTSETLWDALAKLDAPPRRLLVLGGGPIGCELAQAMARLGAGVTLVEGAERLLGREDDEVSAFVHATLAADGIEVLTGHRAVRFERHADGHVLVSEHAGGERRVGFDLLLVAVGRRARLAGYGLEALGIPTAGTIETDAYLQTLVPTIYAAGDVAGPWQFTHTAAHQAWYATVNALFGGLRRFRVDGRVIPAATFVDPEVARVGLNEREARAQGVAFEVTRYGIDDLDRAIVDGEAHGWVKVLTAPGSDRILGVTIVGAHAGDLLAEFVLAMRHGLGLKRVLATVHAYPTFAEASKYAAGAWRRAHQPERLLRWVARYHAWRRGGAAG